MTGVQRRKGTGARVLIDAAKSDTVDQPRGTSRGLLIDGSVGVVKFNDAEGNTKTLNNLLVGVEYNFGVSRVWSSTTTATNIYLLY